MGRSQVRSYHHSLAGTVSVARAGSEDPAILSSRHALRDGDPAARGALRARRPPAPDRVCDPPSPSRPRGSSGRAPGRAQDSTTAAGRAARTATPQDLDEPSLLVVFPALLPHRANRLDRCYSVLPTNTRARRAITRSHPHRLRIATSSGLAPDTRHIVGPGTGRGIACPPSRGATPAPSTPSTGLRLRVPSSRASRLRGSEPLARTDPHPRTRVRLNDATPALHLCVSVSLWFRRTRAAPAISSGTGMGANADAGSAGAVSHRRRGGEIRSPRPHFV